MKQAPQPTRELLTTFDEMHLALLNERAVINGGKDAKLLAALCKSHGPARVKELMALFFACDDEFVHQAGYTVGVFVSQCGKLIARQRLPVGQTRGYRPLGPRLVSSDWREECERLHGGRCTNVHFHEASKAS